MLAGSYVLAVTSAKLSCPWWSVKVLQVGCSYTRNYSHVHLYIVYTCFEVCVPVAGGSHISLNAFHMTG